MIKENIKTKLTKFTFFFWGAKLDLTNFTVCWKSYEPKKMHVHVSITTGGI